MRISEIIDRLNAERERVGDVDVEVPPVFTYMRGRFSVRVSDPWSREMREANPDRAYALTFMRM